MESRYIVVREDKDMNGTPSHDVYGTLEKANSEAEWTWKHMNQYEQKRERLYVIKVKDTDLEESGEWTSYNDFEDGLSYFDSAEIGSIPVEYAGGESRYNPGEGIDYMIAKYDGYGENYLYKNRILDDVTELYAEMENPTWNEEYEYYENDEATYEDLKDAIIEQAEENGLHPSRLSFCND